MIFHGRYRLNSGAFRPFVSARVLAPDGTWKKYSFLADTGADETFLHYASIDILGLDTQRLTVKRDVGGVGGSGVPYFELDTQIEFRSRVETWVFSGKVNVFLDPHATDIPILGRDILDLFATIFDREREDVILLSRPDTYQLVQA